MFSSSFYVSVFASQLPKLLTFDVTLQRLKFPCKLRVHSIIPLPSSKVSEVDAAGFQGSFLKKVCKKNKLF